MTYLQIIPADITNIIYSFVCQPGPYNGFHKNIEISSFHFDSFSINLFNNTPIVANCGVILYNNSHIHVNKFLKQICYDPINRRLLYLTHNCLISYPPQIHEYIYARWFSVCPATGNIWLCDWSNAFIYSSKMQLLYIITMPDMVQINGIVVLTTGYLCLYGVGITLISFHKESRYLFAEYIFVNASVDGIGGICLLTNESKMIYYNTTSKQIMDFDLPPCCHFDGESVVLPALNQVACAVEFSRKCLSAKFGGVDSLLGYAQASCPSILEQEHIAAIRAYTSIIKCLHRGKIVIQSLPVCCNDRKAESHNQNGIPASIWERDNNLNSLVCN